jgi:hypothetical protein
MLSSPFNMSAAARMALGMAALAVLWAAIWWATRL